MSTAAGGPRAVAIEAPIAGVVAVGAGREPARPQILPVATHVKAKGEHEGLHVEMAAVDREPCAYGSHLVEYITPGLGDRHKHLYDVSALAPDDAGRTVPDGVYFLHVETSEGRILA